MGTHVRKRIKALGGRGMCPEGLALPCDRFFFAGGGRKASGETSTSGDVRGKGGELSGMSGVEMLYWEETSPERRPWVSS